MSNDPVPCLKKLTVVGDAGVGKSSLVLRFGNEAFSEAYTATIGVDFIGRSLQIDGKDVKLQIWDTAGQERFRIITQAYFRGAHAIILVYDVTDKESFDSLSTTWLEQVKCHACDDVVKFIVGTKSDLTDKRAVTKEQVQELCSRIGCQHMETSAKNSTNVEVFTTVARLLVVGVGDTADSRGTNLGRQQQQQQNPKSKSCSLL